MKKILLFISIVSLLAISCSKEVGLASTQTLNERIDTLPSGGANNNGGGSVTTKDTTLKYVGDFGTNPSNLVKGKAKIYFKDGRYILALEDFNTSNGPDLHVYLSKEAPPINFIDLGKIKSTNGNQLYDIPGTPDFKIYKYVLIHCQAYNHLFGTAELQ